MIENFPMLYAHPFPHRFEVASAHPNDSQISRHISHISASYELKENAPQRYAATASGNWHIVSYMAYRDIARD